MTDNVFDAPRRDPFPDLGRRYYEEGNPTAVVDGPVNPGMDIMAKANTMGMDGKMAGVPTEIAEQIDAGLNDSLNDRQAALRTALDMIADTFGQFDQSMGADGAHYAPAAKNPFIAAGLVCSACVFYTDPGACDIVSGVIEPNAVCKLWIIPEDALIAVPE